MSSMRRALFALVLIFAAAPQSAPAQTSAVPPVLALGDDTSINPADAPAGEYRLDPRHASVLFRVRHTGVGIFVGRFDSVTGALNFDPQAPGNSSVTATVDAESVNSGILNAQAERAFDGEIREVLGAAEHPDITFTSRAARQTGPTTGVIEGDLSINGQTHPATLEVSFHGGRNVALRGGRYVLAFSGRTIIDRRQWEVGSLVFNQFAGDEIEIVIEAEFVKA